MRWGRCSVVRAHACVWGWAFRPSPGRVPAAATQGPVSSMKLTKPGRGDGGPRRKERAINIYYNLRNRRALASITEVMPITRL